MQYVVVIEQATNNYAAYVPALPGCIATGRTHGEAAAMIREAIDFHLEGLREDGEPIPPAAASLEQALQEHIALIRGEGGPKREAASAFRAGA